MNIPPLLERLLLSNEAVFKNASLGISGDNMVFIPPGKTGVILEVSIEPFINQVNADFMDFLTNGVSNASSDFAPAFRAAMRRAHYQLQIINDKYQTYINLNDGLELVVNDEGADRYRGIATLSFTGKREELFIYTDRSLYFNILYPWKELDEGVFNTGLVPTYDDPATAFLAKIQNLPASPITFNENIVQDYVTKVEVNSPALDSYYPCGHQTNPTFSPELPQMEYLRYFAGFNQSTIEQPVPSGNVLQFHDLFTIPFINVKYALLNKRPDDYGITMPTKK
jgi:hypothetical protein